MRLSQRLDEIERGPDPNQPLRQGEATRDPRDPTDKSRRFSRYFIEELRNQARGTPTKDIDEAPPKSKR